ncbi:MAG: hypothetical protein HGN29_01420 [Asgard group archaeon]|nr:hypothetical protein [Asgard group archaeon]
MKRNQKVFTFGVIVAFLLAFSIYSPIRSYAYDWNVTHSTLLEEIDNVGYGYLTGNHDLENQYLEADYATDIRYVREGAGNPRVDSMDNGSSEFRSTIFSSSFYRSYDKFNYLDNEWETYPTYIQAFNKTNLGPNLNFTTGFNDMGILPLNSKTSLVLEGGIVYVFNVNLKANDIYDLNIKTTRTLYYIIYYEDTFSFFGGVDGVVRFIQPLIARGSGDHIIYLYSDFENDVIINPKEIEIQKIGSGDTVSKRFVNEPDEIWNETRNIDQDNLNRETTHAYFIDIPKGDYQIKYVRFDTGIDAWADIFSSSKYYEESIQSSFMDFSLGTDMPTGYIDKYKLHFEQDFQAIVLITAESHQTDYIEFDYIFSIKEIEIPILESGVVYEYQDDIISFGINIQQTQAVYFNLSTGDNYDLDVVRYANEGKNFGFSYTLEEMFAEDAIKILLEPGLYYFYFVEDIFAPVNYDFEIVMNSIDYEVFTDNMELTLEQENGDPLNYKLIMLNYTQFEFYCYNFSLFMNENYSVDVNYELFLEKFDSSIDSRSFTLGNQEDINGTFQAFDFNNTQELTLYSPEIENIRYLLVSVTEVYNTTEELSSPGTPFVNQTSVTLNLFLDTGYPDDFNDINIVEIELTLDDLGYAIINQDFNTSINEKELYVISVTFPEYTWYKVNITITNGTMDLSDYYFANSELLRPQRFTSALIYSKAYWKREDSNSYIHQYWENTTGPTYEALDLVEFGILSPDAVFMYAIDHTHLTAMNGSVIFEFIPFNCTEIGSIVFVSKGLSKGVIIGLSVAGGVIVVGTAAGVMVRYLGPKGKTPSQPATPPPPRY